MQIEEGPTSVANTLRGAVVQIASPQTSFVCHAFIGRNECVTNEPQRTSAGRL